MDEISLDEIGIKEKLIKEVERFKKFQKVMLGCTNKIEIKDTDIRSYAKYLLREGLDHEKRELMSCFKSKIKMSDKIVTIES